MFVQGTNEFEHREKSWAFVAPTALSSSKAASECRWEEEGKAKEAQRERSSPTLVRVWFYLRTKLEGYNKQLGSSDHGLSWLV